MSLLTGPMAKPHLVVLIRLGRFEEGSAELVTNAIS